MLFFNVHVHFIVAKEHCNEMNHQPNVYYTRRKRRRDEENEELLEELKIEEEAELEPLTRQTKLTNINLDCLEKVFMDLSLDDFINIAHANKDLKVAADLAFGRKFGKTNFELLRSNDHLYWIDDTTLKEFVEVPDMKSSLRLLRCFGHSISDLSIGYHK